tara:strand:+ start:337 stop:543 length:207 start_codon:yes stop_codon:yes gene_type:complete
MATEYTKSVMYRIYPVSARGEPTYTNSPYDAASAVIAGSVVHHTKVVWEKTHVKWDIESNGGSNYEHL